MGQQICKVWVRAGTCRRVLDGTVTKESAAVVNGSTLYLKQQAILYPVPKGITVLGGQNERPRPEHWQGDIFVAVAEKLRVRLEDVICE